MPRPVLKHEQRKALIIVASVLGIGVALANASVVSLLAASPVEGFFRNSKNFLNVWFVKKGWFWTSLLLLLSVALNHFNSKTRAAFRGLVRWVLATLCWATMSRLMHHSDRLLGQCRNASFADPYSCRKGESVWDGIEISGHAFLLSFAFLCIAEESSALDAIYKEDVTMSHTISRQTWSQPVAKVLSALMMLFQLLWIGMLFVTGLYFHSAMEKIFGLAFGVLFWLSVVGLVSCIPENYIDAPLGQAQDKNEIVNQQQGIFGDAAKAAAGSPLNDTHMRLRNPTTHGTEL
ncbi:inositol phospholipid synthesis and fat-storage-inducing TM-domain-containing protein [Polychytrium aggregatum]|uniref:inositol phospholipid synthesis and fat-storage-inducing TM-domain-containing protein n=1 Tax=Polychytrium aggregatum TaxID=110093 RepID=UPI0022FE914E|nr:inositol phospholipid synthesis and fat-storage-inducing TM-domain-containing protein [Polychytrium aggregatum]KAI9203784.1 inositol phospholipid synthesis and fat-storage-inducing TM-domain-containing protein [Polychytrium aggregatum]